MTTKVPFVNSWFILNGPENDRKLFMGTGFNESDHQL